MVDRLWELNDLYQGEENRLWNGDARKQFTYFYLSDMAPIYDFRSAMNQIRLIVEEGEGANVFDLKGKLHKESHFFKFMEIFVGCKIREIKGRAQRQKSYD